MVKIFCRGFFFSAAFTFYPPVFHPRYLIEFNHYHRVCVCVCVSSLMGESKIERERLPSRRSSFPKRSFGREEKKREKERNLEKNVLFIIRYIRGISQFQKIVSQDCLRFELG